MDHLEEVSLEMLQDALDKVEGKRSTKRLTAAIAYKNGVTQTELAEWYGVQRKTIYNWLTRLDEGDLVESAADEHRSGRDRKLTDTQLEKFQETLQKPPTEVGIDAPAWTSQLVQSYLADGFEADYSIPSCRRLMREAGLTYKKPRRQATEADPEEREEFHETVKKSAGIWTPK